MKQILYTIILLVILLSTRVLGQDVSIFPKGEKAENIHHTGEVWLNHISDADKAFDYNIALATFKSGAKLDWHIHPTGQQLLITQGIGYYQERGKEIQVVRKGDVIKCLPGVEHWHAAAPSSDFAYLAITSSKPTQWLERVTEDVYNKINAPVARSPNAENEIIDLSKKKWQSWSQSQRSSWEQQ